MLYLKSVYVYAYLYTHIHRDTHKYMYAITISKERSLVFGGELGDLDGKVWRVDKKGRNVTLNKI